MPILVLSLICLFMTGALAVANSVTRPVIDAAAKERAYAARMEVVPGADDFTVIEADGLPKTVTAIYGANNGAGYVFMIHTIGYGGDIYLICGIGSDGRIIKTATLGETETKGIATPVFDMEPLYIGKDKNLDGIDAVSGATITSNAYINAIRDAFEAYEIIMGMGL